MGVPTIDLTTWQAPKVVVVDWYDGVMEALVRLPSGFWFLCSCIASRRLADPESTRPGVRLFDIRACDGTVGAALASLFPGDATNELEFAHSVAETELYQRCVTAARLMQPLRILLESDNLLRLHGIWELTPAASRIAQRRRQH
jgi:hypothetical protein